MSDLKAIPIGVEDFKRIIDGDYCFVDKSLLIKDILDTKSMVSLFTRPRRFGKTLNMSMLKYFFEKTETDNSYLFENLKISEYKDKYFEHLGQYPVISISLKSMKQGRYDYAFVEFKNIIRSEFWRHRNIFDIDTVSNSEKEIFNKICSDTADDSIYNTSLKLLSEKLEYFYGRKVIILIDEYDVPLEDAYYSGYYDEMVRLIRSAFESALKTNSSLEFAVLTGCLRISKESIFTGLNNLNVFSVTDVKFSEYFGFTENEVTDITKHYGIEHRIPEIKDWYDGYIFGVKEIYNPWSVLKYIQNATTSEEFLPEPYWSNTSSNLIIKQLVEEGSDELHETIQHLILGGSVNVPIFKDITYQNINVNSDYIWSFLLFTGYLKATKSNLVQENIYSTLIIPNREVLSIYKNTITQWFDAKVKSTSHEDLFNSIISANITKTEDILCDWLGRTISFYDQRELYYHGFLTGLLTGFKGYDIKSNRESGNGRPDILILERARHKLAIIIEIKVADRFAQLSVKCDEALKQIEDNNYEAELIEDCYQKIVKFGIAFYEKTCMVKVKE